MTNTANEIQRRLGIENMSITEGVVRSEFLDDGRVSGTDDQARARKRSSDAEYKDDIRFPETASEQDLCEQIRKMDDRWFYSEESSAGTSFSEHMPFVLDEAPSGDLIENWNKIHAKFMKVARRGTTYAGDELHSKESQAGPSGSISERDEGAIYKGLFPALPGERNLAPIDNMPVTGEIGVSWSLSYKRASLIPDRAEDELQPRVMRSDWFVNMLLRLDRETRELRARIQKAKSEWGIDTEEFWHPSSDVEEYICEAGSIVGYRWGHPADRVSRWTCGLEIREWMGEKITVGDWDVNSEVWTQPEEDLVIDGPTLADSEVWQSRHGTSDGEEEVEEKEGHWKDGYYWQWYRGRWWTWYKGAERTIIEGEWWTWDKQEQVYLNEEGKVRIPSSADGDVKETRWGEEDDIAASESDRGSVESYCTGDGIPGQWRE